MEYVFSIENNVHANEKGRMNEGRSIYVLQSTLQPLSRRMVLARLTFYMQVSHGQLLVSTILPHVHTNHNDPMEELRVW